jgi:hypothetical protein
MVVCCGTYGILYVGVLITEPLMCWNYGSVTLLLKISELVQCVPMAITSFLFIGFENMSKEWKVEKGNYEFDIGCFLRLYLN